MPRTQSSQDPGPPPAGVEKGAGMWRAVRQLLNVHLAHDPASLGVDPSARKTYPCQILSTRVLLEFIQLHACLRIPTWKRSAGELISKLRFVFKMDSEMKRRELLVHTTTRVILKNKNCAEQETPGPEYTR